MLRGEDNVITEVIIIPGSTFGRGFTSTRFDMIPIDSTIIGSFHSHPSHSFAPSNADILFFGKGRKIHLIVRYPYKDINDVAAYNERGERIPIEVTCE